MTLVYEPNYSHKFRLNLYGAVKSGTLSPQRWLISEVNLFSKTMETRGGLGFRVFAWDRMGAGTLE